MSDDEVDLVSDAIMAAAAEHNPADEAECPSDLPYDDFARAALAAIRPQVNVEAELADEKAYAHKLQVALTGLAGGGSENFVSHGDGFRADITFCVGKVQRRFDEALEEKKRSLRATPAPPPQTSGSVPDEIARAITAYGRANLYTRIGDFAADDERTIMAARAHLDALILAHVAPSAAVIPEGWKLVPIEPTPDMRLAAQDAFPRSASFVFPKLWDTMLTASPTPPAISIADIVALLMSEEVKARSRDQITANLGSTPSWVETTLRVAAETVLKLGAGS